MRVTFFFFSARIFSTLRRQLRGRYENRVHREMRISVNSVPRGLKFSQNFSPNDEYL